MADQQRAKKGFIAVAVIGILLQVTGLVLMVTERVPIRSALPFVIIGMFLAFVPIFGQLNFSKK